MVVIDKQIPAPQTVKSFARKRRVAIISILVTLLYISLMNSLEYHRKLKMLCGQGRFEDAQNLATDQDDPCLAVIRDDLFSQYTPIMHETGPDQHGNTTAYALTVTRCPEFYQPGVDNNPDPGKDIFEAYAIVKDQICRETNKDLDMEENNVVPSCQKETMYAIVNPNGVTCLKDGSRTEYYDRVTMFRDLGFRVERVGQPITDDLLLRSQPYISEHIEEDVGVRDTTRLHAWRLVEHPALVMFDHDRIFQDAPNELIHSLKADPSIKGYYIRQPACNAQGSSLIDTGFMVIRPSQEEFKHILNAYLDTPYDPETGWNGKGHNQCGGKLGLPGFFSYYFSKTPGYIEIDRCKYSFSPDDECINNEISHDAKASSEIIDIVKNGLSRIKPTTEEGVLVNDAMRDVPSSFIDADTSEVRILPVDEEHIMNVEFVEDESVAIMQVFVEKLTSVRKILKMTGTEDGGTAIEVLLDNGFRTTSDMVQAIADDPSAINSPVTVDEFSAISFISNALARPVIVSQSSGICGKPTDCPPNNPDWTRSQKLACEEVHSKFFMIKRRTEFAMRKIDFSQLYGQYKPKSFLGYCKGPGRENYIGIKINGLVKAPEWQVVCEEPISCAFGQYVKPDCTCSSYDNPCEACPSGTRCQLSPTFLCIDCECGSCDKNGSPCCGSDSDQCTTLSQGSECMLQNNFFAAMSGEGSVCDKVLGIWNTPQGCGCAPSDVAPCSYDRSIKEPNMSCFSCTAADLASSDRCLGCNFCLGMTNDCIGSSNTEDEFQECIALISYIDKANCKDMCTKKF